MLLSWMAILASVAVVASAAPAGSASAEELRDSGSQSDVSTLGSDVHNVGVYFHVSHGLSLGKPKVAIDRFSGKSKQLLDAGGKGAGYTFTMKKSEYGVDRSEMAVSWPILVGATGSDSGYRVLSSMKGPTNNLDWEESCRIVAPSGVSENHFHCYQYRRGLDFDWDLRISDDRVDRRAEASGVIKTVGAVSLTSAGFPTNSESKLQVSGAETVPVESSTRFEAVLTPKDTEDGRRLNEPDTARVEFLYAVNDGDKPAYSKKNGRQLYIRGYVSNHRARTFFSGGAWCEFVTGRFNEVEKDPGYSCTPVWGGYDQTGVPDGHVHYMADFEVSKNQ